MRRHTLAWLGFAACMWSISPVPAAPSLRFEENHGQVDASVRFFVRAPGYTLYLTDEGAVFDLRGAEPVTMRFVGTDSGARVRGADLLPGRTNYFIGNRPERWRTSIPSHARVVYEALYPGVDAVFRESNGEIEFDFVIDPGADPGRVGLELQGAESVELSDEGSLLVAGSNGSLRMHAPAVFQLEGGGPVPIEGRFVIADAGRRIRFALGEYDASRPLVIDPILSFSTYLGGTDAGDEIQDLTVDDQGNTYVIGFTQSDNFPVANALDDTQDSNFDGFVSKIGPDGSTLVYSTYFGGDRDENFPGAGIAVNAAGEVFITGQTSGGTFPTTGGAYEEDPQGLTDCYVAKLSADGSTLLYSTILGGSSHDRCHDIAVDGSGNAYVVGEANSADYPTTGGTYQEIKNPGADVVVTKVNSTGDGLVFSTFVGGSVNDTGKGIALVGGGAVITGHTSSSANYPVASAFQGMSGGGLDAFVTRLNAAGNALVYSSFLGGSGFEYGLAIASDSADDSVFVTGYSQSTTDFPTTAGAFQEMHAGGQDIFVVKVDDTGGLVYSTLVGGTGGDKGTGIAVAGGYARLTGTTSSSNFPTQSPIQAAQANPAVPGDAFVATIAADGSTLAFSTYLGGNGSEGLRDEAGIGLGPDGAIHVAGRTSAHNFPTTAGSFQDSDPDPSIANTPDGWVAKIHECETTNLHFTTQNDFEWSPTGMGQCGIQYDAVRGDLFGIRNTGGDFSGATCIENDEFDTVAADSDVPISGQGFWYLARVDGSTWDGPNQTGHRDATLAVCP